ncbi:LptF/LptG family permease [Campylobacter jejuni]|uniref:LptF/LptG family permease n=2 Tax=Campylobacter jejuni TaxID=197 RepID=UPI00070762A8|nr:LptF/LptG family permease [Campylobacter jejuni]KQI22452.1 membrane protein [Campylobacter jejuni CVM 41910]
MWIFFRFISGIYLKNFFIIFFSLLGFYCGIDLLLNFKDLPKAANLDLLYVMFLSFSAVPYVLPISLIFALVVSLISMIRANEFVSLYALGLSRNYVILFPFLWALFFCCIYIGLNFTSFAYANDYKRNILKNGTIMNQSGEVFLKFNNNFVYISKINNGQNSAQNIKIFNINDLNLSSFVSAKNAHFEGESWILRDGNITLLPKNYELANDGLKIQDFSELKSLEGFKPKIIEGVASNSDYSISDALESFELFKAQNVNTDALKINLYKFVFTFLAFVVTLMIWGVLFLLTRLSENSVIASEIGIVVPIIILGCLSAYMYYKHR